MEQKISNCGCWGVVGGGGCSYEGPQGGLYTEVVPMECQGEDYTPGRGGLSMVFGLSFVIYLNEDNKNNNNSNYSNNRISKIKVGKRHKDERSN